MDRLLQRNNTIRAGHKWRCGKGESKKETKNAVSSKKGKVKEVAGKDQEKMGQVKKVVGK